MYGTSTVGSPNAVFNGSWNGLASQAGVERATEKIISAVDKGFGKLSNDMQKNTEKHTAATKTGAERVVDAVGKIKPLQNNQGVPVENAFYIPEDYRKKMSEKARIVLASMPEDYIASASSIQDAANREGFRNYLVWLVEGSQSEGTVMNSTPALAQSARTVLESLPADFVKSGTIGTPQSRQGLKELCEFLASANGGISEQSAVSQRQELGRAASYIEVPDADDRMPTSGDLLNDIRYHDESESSVNPLFDGYAANEGMIASPATLPVNNAFSGRIFNAGAIASAPCVGSFNELFGG
jgi:hypothetical protein